ncbi:2OG-Fe(II) oxygenase family protein [Reyranella sp.]|uniref:2OG-Fe(II) oxygenase family protein n=1 Tax=Reyranella sp. TaxID=1929291 RepID=UPI0011F7A24E|nr:2OG-Fe(II) oxygenase family protein [Reyranella sp.]TAJ82160.1 MAG: hypothetical protein EPO50_28120 [Reyranella sp.]
MSSSSLAFETVAAFATPIIVVDLPDGTQLNAALLPVLLKREAEQPSESRSTLGGWQSSLDLDKWAGAPAVKLLAIARNIANRITTDRTGKPVAILWQANMWANINRSGHGNEFHSHPGSFWSGVYYVDDGGVSAHPALGGELEFMDPRGPAPAMYAPHLAFALPGGLSAGTNQTIVPKAGRLVMFPAWLLHQVRPYLGAEQRISIAFNLSL